MTYDPMTERNYLSKACVKAMGAILSEHAPSVGMISRDDTGAVVTTVAKVPILFVNDEVSYTEYQTPSIVIFNPTLSTNRALILNENVYKDFNYETLVAKEFREPIPVNVRFKIHAATRNPDNDLILQEFFMRLSRLVSVLDIEVVPAAKLYDRCQVVWYDPVPFDTNDVSQIREIECSVQTWLEVLQYKEVRLLEGGNAVELVQADFLNSKYCLFTRSSHDVYKNASEIPVSSVLTGFPLSGEAVIGDEVFTYTSRTKRKFLGVSGITRFYPFNTEIVVN